MANEWTKKNRNSFGKCLAGSGPPATTRNIKNCFSCFTYKEHGIIQMRSNHLHFVLGASFCIWATIIFAIIMVLSEKLCSICTPEVPVEWIYCFTPLQNIYLKKWPHIHVPFVVIRISYFSHAWLSTGFVPIITRWVSLVEQEHITFSEFTRGL
jgi:hypothetical protein